MAHLYIYTAGSENIDSAARPRKKYTTTTERGRELKGGGGSERCTCTDNFVCVCLRQTQKHRQTHTHACMHLHMRTYVNARARARSQMHTCSGVSGGCQWRASPRISRWRGGRRRSWRARASWADGDGRRGSSCLCSTAGSGRAHARALAHTHTNTHASDQTRTHTHTCTNTYANTHASEQTRTHTHTCTNTYAHLYTHTYTRTGTYSRARARTHTHTHDFNICAGVHLNRMHAHTHAKTWIGRRWGWSEWLSLKNFASISRAWNPKILFCRWGLSAWPSLIRPTRPASTRSTCEEAPAAAACASRRVACQFRQSGIRSLKRWRERVRRVVRAEGSDEAARSKVAREEVRGRRGTYHVCRYKRTSARVFASDTRAHTRSNPFSRMVVRDL